jgi:hypothetical protein
MHTTRGNDSASGHFAVDTTFVLFFLAMDFGQSLRFVGLDTVFSLVTLGLLLVVPYFLPFEGEKPDFAGWFFGRTLIAIFATALGMMYGQALGVLLPQTFSYLPMTFLIATAMLSCYLQLYGMMKLRLAR